MMQFSCSGKAYGQVRHGCDTTTYPVPAAIRRSQASPSTLSRELETVASIAAGRSARVSTISVPRQDVALAVLEARGTVIDAS